MHIQSNSLCHLASFSLTSRLRTGGRAGLHVAFSLVRWADWILGKALGRELEVTGKFGYIGDLRKLREAGSLEGESTPRTDDLDKLSGQGVEPWINSEMGSCCLQLTKLSELSEKLQPCKARTIGQ